MGNLAWLPQTASLRIGQDGSLISEPEQVSCGCLLDFTSKFNSNRLNYYLLAGLWALDYGDEHPNSQVIGVDLSPIQPQL